VNHAYSCSALALMIPIFVAPDLFVLKYEVSHLIKTFIRTSPLVVVGA